MTQSKDIASISYQLLSVDQLRFVLSRTSPHSFEYNIRKMNAMYKLPINTWPTLHGLHRPNGDAETATNRMTGFLKTLKDECDEGTEIYWKLRLIEHYETTDQAKAGIGYRGFEVIGLELLNKIKDVFLPLHGGDKFLAKLLDFNTLCDRDLLEAEKDVLTDIADWLGDIMVYCRSEAMKYGLPLENCLEAIMGSNATKLGPDGVPKHDENGKFLKDMSNFVPPEPALKTQLFGLKTAYVDDQPHVGASES